VSHYHQLCCCDAFPCDCASYQVRCGCFTQNNIEITYRQTVYLDTIYGSFLVSESRYTMRTLDPATVVGCLYRKWPQVEIEYESTEHDLLVKGVISNSTYPPGTFPPECIEMCDGCDLTVPACTLEKIGIVTNKTWTSSGTVIKANEDGEILRLVCFGYCDCGCPPCPRAMVRYTPEDKFIFGDLREQYFAPCTLQTSPPCDYDPPYDITTKDGFTSEIREFNIVSNCQCHDVPKAWTPPRFYSEPQPSAIPFDDAPQWPGGLPTAPNNLFYCAGVNSVVCADGACTKIDNEQIAASGTWTFNWSCTRRDPATLVETTVLCTADVAYSYRCKVEVTIQLT
jgi:hypothetical protein